MQNTTELFTIKQNYLQALNYIRRAQQTYRHEKPVKLIVVTKNASPEEIQYLIDLGHKEFAESKVQEAEKKWKNFKLLDKTLKLSFIGNLQNNKVNKALQLFDTIASIHSFELLKTLHTKSIALNKNLKCYLEINIAEEPQKYGIPFSKLQYTLDKAEKENLRIDGLMCIPPINEPPFPYFALMQKFSKEYNIPELSMGMSNDFVTAIKFGATEVRIGKLIFKK